MGHARIRGSRGWVTARGHPAPWPAVGVPATLYQYTGRIHLGAFGTAERLAAWAGVCPGNDRSAGKRRSARARMGNKALRAVLVECAHGAARTHGCQFRGYHKALMVRRGYKRAIVATAHKLLRVLYVVLRDARPYHDPEADYEELMVRGCTSGL